jgi:hypothetical protein
MDAHPESTLPLSKRRRVTRACDNCKSRKRRCNGEKPCAYCTEHRALCTYDAPYTRGKSDNVTVPVSRDEPTSPRGLSRWPHLARHSVASTHPPMGRKAAGLDHLLEVRVQRQWDSI